MLMAMVKWQRRVYAPAAMKPALFLFSLLGLCACKPQIGDSCRTSLDCSSTATRLCDRTQPQGYCTIPSCEQGSCPAGSVCVLFRSTEPRLSASYCMYGCDNATDCRPDQGYWCLGENDFGIAGQMEALVLDGSKNRFCAQYALPLVPLPDAGLLQHDAGLLGRDASVDAAQADAAAKP